jgi:hypothetical protein
MPSRAWEQTWKQTWKIVRGAVILVLLIAATVVAVKFIK